MNRKYISIIALAAVIPMLSFGIMENQPQLEDGKLISMASGLRANLSPLELADRADLIIKGTVVNLSTEVDDTEIERGIVVVHTIAEVQPTLFIKGQAEGNLLVRYIGGETDDYKTFSEYLTLKNNDDVLMHLTVADDGETYNVFSGTTTTFVITDGKGKNAHQEYVSESELIKSYSDLVSLQTRD